MASKITVFIKSHLFLMTMTGLFLVSVASSYMYSRVTRLKNSRPEGTLPKQNQQPAGNSNVSTMKSMTLGSLSMVAEKETSTSGRIVNIKVQASSEERNVVGYDIILKYDTGLLNLLSNRSLLAGFDIYVFKNDDGVTVTGLKHPNDVTNTVLDQTPILDLRFQAQNEGDYQFSIEPKRNKEKTQMVDENTEVFYPSINEVTVTIE